jgi:hypothetical protein
VALKVLHGPFMLLRGSARFKGPQISSLSRLCVLFSGIEPILAGFEFSDHREFLLMNPCNRRSAIRPWWD